MRPQILLATFLTLWIATPMAAQTLRPLSVSPGGTFVDDAGKPVALRGLNRSATGSGNADATATDADYATQNKLLSMNLVRIFVNATWWNNNVQVPIAAQPYQTYIDTLIQRAKKYGNYVLILKAGQFPDAPCGADNKNCPAPNQGDLNCAANPSLCLAQDTTGNAIDAAFNFWAGFAQKYASDPAILYDTWEDMHGIDANTWIDNQNQLIATIRAYNPRSVIFVEDTASAFEAIVGGTLGDLAWSNIVWNFHLFQAGTGACAQTASARYANWPKNFDPLVSYAQQHGHAVAIAEWGGCNDAEPYSTNITSYAQMHQIALAYFDSSNLIAASQLSAIGTQVAKAYGAIAAGGPSTVTSVSSAYGQQTTLAAESIASAYGSGLATSALQAPSLPLPFQLNGTSVSITDANGVVRRAGIFYVSPTQVNFEVPPGVAPGSASVTIALNGAPAGFGTASILPVAPALYTVNGAGTGAAAGVVLTIHADGTSSVADLSAPIDLGSATDSVYLELFGTGLRAHTGVVSSKIGTLTLPVSYAGPQGTFTGLDQVNIAAPKALKGMGQVQVALSVDGQSANVVTVNFK